MLFHIRFSAAETNPFGFEAESLLDSGVAAELDFSTRAQDALPG